MAESESQERKYTGGTQIFQELGQGFSRAAYRIANGMAEGTRIYKEKSEQSADAKQDGAVRDFLVNSAEGFSAAVSEMGKAPLEIAKATDSEAAWDAAQSLSDSVDKALRRDKDKEDKDDK